MGRGGVKTRQQLLSYITGLEGHDLSLALALCELLHRADASGRAERGRWIASVREAHERLSMGRAAPAAPLMSTEGEALGQYLEQQAVGRLEDAGIAHREPRDETWEHLRVEPELWEVLVGARDAVHEELGRVVAELASRRGVSAHVPAVVAPSSGGSRLRAEGLTKIYRKRRVVNEVDIEVTQGEIVGLLGPNGAGKTTTFYMVVGLISPNEGRVFLDDRELTTTPMYKRARLGIGYLAQEPSIFRKLTVEENVQAILETLDLPRKEERARLEELLQELSIGHLRKSKAYSLSGGERRRLEITRALVQRPKFMLLDEPFAGIDPIAVNDIQQIVAELKTRDIGVIISDHNVEQTLEIVDRAYIMYEGRIRVSGTVSELVWNDEVAEIYLGPILTERMRERFARPPGPVAGVGAASVDVIDPSS
jgi:lipopolysaccharide export system ATP-binding protein